MYTCTTRTSAVIELEIKIRKDSELSWKISGLGHNREKENRRGLRPPHPLSKVS